MILEVSQESQMWVSCFCNIRILPSDSSGGFSVCCRVYVKKGIRGCWEAAFQIVCLTGSAHFVSAAQIPAIGKRWTLGLCVCVRGACSDSRHGFFHTLRGLTYHLVTSSLALEDPGPKDVCKVHSSCTTYCECRDTNTRARHAWSEVLSMYSKGQWKPRQLVPSVSRKASQGTGILESSLLWRVSCSGGCWQFLVRMLSPQHILQLVKWKNDEKRSKVSPGLPRDLPCKGPHHL